MSSISPALPWFFATLTVAGGALAAPVDHALGTAVPEADIVGGGAAPPGKWPDAAAVMNNSGAFCSGTLIAPDLVLTAGHCTDGITPTRVKLDATDSGGPGETIAVADVHTYPNYLQSYDVAVLVLASPATAAPREIAPACAIESSLNDAAPIDLVGYGATDYQAEDPNSRLNEVRVNVTDAECNDGNGCVAAIAPGGEFSAGGGGLDSCNGDSGGPAYLPTPNGTFLVGVVSRALDNASQPCGGGGIYVRADAVLDWIRQTTGKSIPDADCVAGGDEEPNGDDGDGDGDGDGSGNGGGGGSGGGSGGGDDDGQVVGGCAAAGAPSGLLGATVLLLALGVALRPARRRRLG